MVKVQSVRSCGVESQPPVADDTAPARAECNLNWEGWRTQKGKIFTTGTVPKYFGKAGVSLEDEKYDCRQELASNFYGK